jgi:hypothetical protein
MFAAIRISMTKNVNISNLRNDYCSHDFACILAVVPAHKKASQQDLVIDVDNDKLSHGDESTPPVRAWKSIVVEPTIGNCNGSIIRLKMLPVAHLLSSSSKAN